MSSTTTSDGGGRGVPPAQLDAVMAASRVLVGLIAESAGEVDDQVTAAQLRILVLVERTPGLNLSALAEAMGVHASNATRACDRLVRSGLLSRTESEHDRRNLRLELTDDGRRLVQRVMDHRRSAFDGVLRRMGSSDRAALAVSLTAFAAAAGEHPDDSWSP